MTLTTRQAILAALPGSPLQIGARVGVPPAAVHNYLVELRDHGAAIKTNKGGFALR